MVKRIDLFMPPRSQYGVLHYFTVKLSEALNRIGVASRTLEAEHDNPRPFLDKLFADRPDCTLSFNGLLPDEEGRFFCDMIQIPHVACLVDAPTQFFSLIKSPKTIITCADESGCEFFRGLHCHHTLFMPHAADKELTEKPFLKERVYDVVVMASLIDYERLRTEWDEKYHPAVCKAMDDAVEMTMADAVTPYVQAFVTALDRRVELTGGLDPRKIDFVSILDDLEVYLKGVSRIQSIRAVKDAEVHVFGSEGETATWADYLGDAKNVVIHDPVPFEQALDIIGQSKILLNACPWVKDGAHERIFTGMALGALVITNENNYLNNHFKNGKELVMFKNGSPDEINGLINEYLSDKKRWEQVIEAGRKAVIAGHTWDHRAAALVKALDPILQDIAARGA